MDQVDAGKSYLVSSEVLNEIITSVNEWNSLVLEETTGAIAGDASTLVRAEAKSILRISHPACP